MSKKPAKKPAPKKAAAKKTPRPKSTSYKASDTWTLRLYVAGQTPKSLAAFSNLKKICDQHLPGRYNIEVIDLLKNPQLAHSDQIFAIPTLVRKIPVPIKKIIGDLSNVDRFLLGFDLKPADA